jgi:maltose 6'-phosphate phosphatase
MKLLTLNCHSYFEENQMQKIKILAKTIADNKYDVIALQDVSQTVKQPGHYLEMKEDNYANILIDELTSLGSGKYDCHWVFNHLAGFGVEVALIL